MNLTIYDLDTLKKECDYISKFITEIKNTYNPSSYERKLFVSRADYDESLKIKNEKPQDFYFFRCFDIFVQIVYNKKTKLYMIYIDGFYSHILDKYKRNQRSNKSYEISKDFENCFLIFKEIIIDIFDNKVLQNGLF